MLDSAQASSELKGGAASSANDGAALATLIERIVRGVERGGRQWTMARRKDSLQRVLAGSRSDSSRLQQRLSQLVASWDSDGVDRAIEVEEPVPAMPPAESAAVQPKLEWNRVVTSLDGTLRQGLPASDGAEHPLALALAALTRRVHAEGATSPLADEVEQLCQRAARVLQHRHRLVDQLGGLCHELTAGLTDLAEDDSWAQGQCDAMRGRL